MPAAISGPLVAEVTLPSTTTLAKMKACVYRGIRDSDMEFAPPGDIVAYINEGYLDLCSRLRLVQKEASGTTTAAGLIPFPSDYIELDTIQIGTQDLQEATDVVFDSYKVPGSTPPVTLYRFWGTNIETYPAQESVAYTLRYVGQPTELANDSDLFTYLPKELEIRVCRYARAQVHATMHEQDQADREMEVYLRGLPDYPRAAHRLGIGPDQLTPQASYFLDDA